MLNGLRIGARQPGAVPAGVSDLSYLEGVRIDAIVGLDVLARTSFSIDYRKHVLRFSPGGREESVAPLKLAWPFLTVQMTIAGQQVRLLVDTGSSDLVLFKSRMPPALSRALEGRQNPAICVRCCPPAAARSPAGSPGNTRLGQADRLGARSGAGRIPAEHRRRARGAGPRLPAGAVRLRAKRSRVEPVNLYRRNPAAEPRLATPIVSARQTLELKGVNCLNKLPRSLIARKCKNPSKIGRIVI